MIKKFALILIIISFTVSCGKKDDPEYKESGKKSLILNDFIRKV
tara:strand:- start:72 stop:203 length:132 start_codon:yes stop_codon:yes gene_type:complete